MWNTFLTSICGELLGGGLGAYFLFVHGSKLVVSEGSVGRTMVGLEGGQTSVEVTGQEDVMRYGR